MGEVERSLRDRAADSLAEVEHLEIRPMFSGFGFYVNGVLTAAAIDECLQLRFRRAGHWVYEPIDDTLVDDPDQLVPLFRGRAADLAALPEARGLRPADTPGPGDHRRSWRSRRRHP